MRLALASALLAVALAAPLALAAQPAAAPAPASLEAATNAYFGAVFHGDVTALAHMTSPNFHWIDADGKRRDINGFLYEVSSQYLKMQAPSGYNFSVKSSALTPAGATETVSTVLWFSGVSNIDPMQGPTLERDFGTHQLTWVKSGNGEWKIEEDHTTSLMRT